MMSRHTNLLSYFKLSTNGTSAARTANKDVLENFTEEMTGLTENELKNVCEGISEAEGRPKKRRMVYKEEDKLRIAVFAHRNGPARAVKNFIDDFTNLTESTIRGWLTKYRSQIRNKAPEKQIIISAKRGRPLALPDELDLKLRKFLGHLRDGGGNIN